MTSIIGLCRSPFCPIYGHLYTLNSCDLITRVIESALKRAHVDPKWVKSVYIGQVIPQLQNINTIAKGLREIGLVNSNITTLNTMSNSGFTSIILANKMVSNLGLLIAGGVDSISNSPYMIRNINTNIGDKCSDGVLYNSVKNDYFNCDSKFGLSSSKDDYLNNLNITNSDVENFRMAIWKRTLDSLSANILEQETTPFKVKTPSIKPDNRAWITPPERVIHRDQLLADIPKLNQISETPLVDGAAAIVLSSLDFIKKNNLNEITRIIASSECSSDSLEDSIKNSLKECLTTTNLTQSKIDVYEIEDNVTHIPILISKLLNIDSCRINLHGGSTAIGFCPGASGTRLIISLTSVLRSRGLRYGCAISVNSLGQVSTIIMENPAHN